MIKNGILCIEDNPGFVWCRVKELEIGEYIKHPLFMQLLKVRFKTDVIVLHDLRKARWYNKAQSIWKETYTISTTVRLGLNSQQWVLKKII
jgi:hypothetical protein